MQRRTEGLSAEAARMMPEPTQEEFLMLLDPSSIDELDFSGDYTNN